MGVVSLARDSRPVFFSLLCRRLYRTPFTWTLQGDEDRAKDGQQLRIFFAEETKRNVPDGPVNVLEVLVALSMRTDDWLSGGENGPNAWFMTMLHNLGLDGFTDDTLMDHGMAEKVDYILEKWMNREYEYNGNGGLFPLRNPPDDQRCDTFEYQLQLYLKENWHLIGEDFG